MQDDGLYLSPMYLRYDRLLGKATLHIYQNYFRRALTMLASAAPEPSTPIRSTSIATSSTCAAPGQARPAQRELRRSKPYAGHVMGDHGSPPWPSMFSYHNTFVSREPGRRRISALESRRATRIGRGVRSTTSSSTARDCTTFALPESAAVQSDGNLYWSPKADASGAVMYSTSFAR